MNILCCLLTLSFAALSAFGQGSLQFNGVGGPFVYGVDPADPTSRVLSFPREKLAGDGYSAQLFWGLTGTPEASLEPVTTTPWHFKEGTSAGQIDLGTLSSSRFVFQGALGGTKVSLQFRAWDNRGGSVTTWAQVLKDNTVPRGMSESITNYELSGVDADNAPHIGSGNLAKSGLSSFGLYLVPEPSIIAISLLGLGALLRRRRDRVGAGH